jgi:hypothetical protein
MMRKIGEGHGKQRVKRSVGMSVAILFTSGVAAIIVTLYLYKTLFPNADTISPTLIASINAI